MKLATLQSSGRDGNLVVVNRQLTKARLVANIALTLQSALDNWTDIEPQLKQVYHALNEGKDDALTFEPRQTTAPLPRAYQWLDRELRFFT